ncbi:HlyD family secretion protein [Haliangium sp.]|uniref:HlyD family secretion protein n=1 Tax=Haliangium sp. TaxID=2663208 RepID=UPI003D09FD32
MTSKINRRWTWIASALILLASAASVAAALTAESPLTARPIDAAEAAHTVTVGAAGDERMPEFALAGERRWITGNGVVEPADREISVAAAVPGRVAAVQVVEGAVVEAGDALVSFEQEVERAALAAAEAEVVSARAELARLRRGSRAQDIAAAERDAAAARARAALSQGVLTRTEAAARTGGATRDELARARHQAAADRATADAAEARHELSAAGSRIEDVHAARARVAAAEARRDQARATLARLTVRAPTAGEILQLKVRPGEYYQPGGAEPLLLLGDTRTLRVRVDVDERDLAALALGAEAHVTARAHPARHFSGRVVEIGRRMGRKNVRTDDPAERNDVKILEVVVELDQGPTAADSLIVGQRVMSYIAVAPEPLAERP